ncbi:FitA-like ribbon-helix-helix domain-containing protein [Methylohalobius crimeensis]|uniref:FitA-like ribbon-helix-helix domain-containing protein n=1 Tax=Methylohalobius crimeensis TaxID=244365 RepID=UPI0003B4EB9B|nr:plasmid stabilization protein [Methylohalobius crimeensis]
MASLTIRNIDESLKANLRLLAARHGHSMEEEVRQILRRAIQSERASQGIGSRIAKRFASVGGVDLPEPERSPPRLPPDMSVDGE